MTASVVMERVRGRGKATSTRISPVSSRIHHLHFLLLKEETREAIRAKVMEVEVQGAKCARSVGRPTWGDVTSRTSPVSLVEGRGISLVDAGLGTKEVELDPRVRVSSMGMHISRSSSVKPEPTRFSRVRELEMLSPEIPVRETWQAWALF